jgi:hypothetical protein
MGSAQSLLENNLGEGATCKLIFRIQGDHGGLSFASLYNSYKTYYFF